MLEERATQIGITTRVDIKVSLYISLRCYSKTSNPGIKIYLSTQLLIYHNASLEIANATFADVAGTHMFQIMKETE